MDKSGLRHYFTNILEETELNRTISGHGEELMVGVVQTSDQRTLFEGKGAYVPRALYSSHFCKIAEFRPHGLKDLRRGKGAYVPRVLYSSLFCKNAEYRPPGPKDPRRHGQGCF